MMPRAIIHLVYETDDRSTYYSNFEIEFYDQHLITGMIADIQILYNNALDSIKSNHYCFHLPFLFNISN